MKKVTENSIIEVMQTEAINSIAAQEKDLLKVRAGQGIVNFFIYSRIDDVEILDVSGYKPRRIPSPTWR